MNKSRGRTEHSQVPISNFCLYINIFARLFCVTITFIERAICKIHAAAHILVESTVHY